MLLDRDTVGTPTATTVGRLVGVSMGAPEGAIDGVTIGAADKNDDGDAEGTPDIGVGSVAGCLDPPDDVCRTDAPYP
jgi:hypothetical protein